MIPAWLLAKHGGNLRAAHLGTCPRCGAGVLRGLDAQTCAITATVDIQPVDEIGEALALFQGRATYDLVGARHSKELEYRSAWNIKAVRRYPVHAQHRCGQPLPPAAMLERPQTAIPDVPLF